MARRIIDISVPLQNDIASDPPGTSRKSATSATSKARPQVCKFFPGLSPADLPDREGWAMERIDISTHNGTHLDAPWHFASTMDGGKRAITIDEVPLDWCFQPGVKLDFRRFADGYVAHRRRRGGRTETHRPPAEAARYRGGQYLCRHALR